MSDKTPDLPADLMEPAEGEPSGRISATFKEGTGFDAAWIVVEADNAVELSNLIQRLRQVDAFRGVRRVAAEFRGPLAQMSTPASQPDPLAAAEAAVRQAFPNAQEVPDQPSGPPAQTDSIPCPKCGANAPYREGTGRNGTYKGYACTADRTHFEHVR